MRRFKQGSVTPRRRQSWFLFCIIVAFGLFWPPLSFVPKAGAPIVRVALTRETGRNAPLRGELERLFAEDAAIAAAGDWEFFETPCIEHGLTTGFDDLVSRLSDEHAQSMIIVLTSPEAARVFLLAWQRAGSLFSMPVASIGAGTSLALAMASEGLATAPVVEFEASTATADALGKELPCRFGSDVVFPASSRAATTLERRLAERGFNVQRYDSYTTREVRGVTDESRRHMETSDVVTFGSPSAVHAWARICPDCRPVAACIGETSKQAAEAAGFIHALAPAMPGLANWAAVVAEAVRDVLARRKNAEHCCLGFNQ